MGGFRGGAERAVAICFAVIVSIVFQEIIVK